MGGLIFVIGSLLAGGFEWPGYWRASAPTRDIPPPPAIASTPPQIVVSPTIVMSPTINTGNLSGDRPAAAPEPAPSVAAARRPELPPAAPPPAPALPEAPVSAPADPPVIAAPSAVPVAAPAASRPPASPLGCIVLGAAPAISVKQSDVLCSPNGEERIVVESWSSSRLYYLVEGRQRNFCVFGELCGLSWASAPRFIVRPPRPGADGAVAAEIVMQ